MGYHVNDSMVRVDRFKERGKWYDSHMVDMNSVYHHNSIHDGLKECLARDGINIEGYIIVCLEPYHKHAHPIMLKDHLKD